MQHQGTSKLQSGLWRAALQNFVILSEVCLVLWHLSESLRRKLFNNTIDKL